MMKRILALLMALCLLPILASAEIPYEYEANLYIRFPTLNEWRGRFSKRASWVIVTPDNLEENWDRVYARGDTEEEIRARYASETFLFEAYSSELPEDACFRAEVFENDFTRDVWHFRHYDTAERRQLNDYLESGRVLTDRDVYGLNNYGSGGGANVQGYFTNEPPATMESGKLRIEFRNGKMYVFSYVVCGRQAGARRWYSNREDNQYGFTPVGAADSAFKDELLPRMAECRIDGAFPEDVAPGNVRVTGKVEAGGKLAVTLDGEKVTANVRSNGEFIVILPLKEIGEHAVTLTATHKKYADRVKEYTVCVSDALTPLTVTEDPDGYADVDDVTITGLSDPGAQIELRGGAEVLASAETDGNGAFSLTWKVEKRGQYDLILTAQAGEKEINQREISFEADYEDIDDAIKDFSKELTETKIKDIWADVESHLGEKVKVSVYVKEVVVNEQGLGLIGVHYDGDKIRNGYGGSYIPSDEDNQLLYVNLPGYAQCQLGPKMILTVYASVTGKRVLFTEDGEEQERIELTMDYGTYLK